MPQYPHLSAMLADMALDNDMRLRAHPRWPANSAVLEALAASLSKTEKSIMACGEHKEMQSLVKRKGLHALDAFLNSAFDGDLSDKFFE